MRTVVEQAVVVAAAGRGVGVENLPPHSSGSPNELVPRGWQQCTHRRAACAGDLHSGGQRWRAEQVGRGAGILSAANSRVSVKSVSACTGAPPRPAGSRAWRPPRSCRPRPGAPRCLPRRRGRHSSERPGERTMEVRPPVKTGQVHGQNGQEGRCAWGQTSTGSSSRVRSPAASAKLKQYALTCAGSPVRRGLMQTKQGSLSH